MSTKEYEYWQRLNSLADALEAQAHGLLLHVDTIRKQLGPPASDKAVYPPAKEES